MAIVEMALGVVLGGSGAAAAMWWRHREGHTAVPPQAEEPHSTQGAAPLEAGLLEETLEHVAAAVLVGDAHSTVRYRNKAGATLLAATDERSLVRDAALDLLDRAVGGQECVREVELFGPPASTFVVRAAPLGIESHGRTGIGAVVLVDDLSDRRRLDQLRRDFVANISHELKTPVGAIGLLAETLDHELGEDDADTDVVRRLVERIDREMGRMAATIDDLLELSRVEAGDELELEVLAVDELLDEVVARLAAAVEARRIHLDVTAEAGLVVDGDRRQLVSALVNLVENALKYSADESKVRVAATAVDASVQVVVADEGIGIPARDLARVFERFYRVDRGRSRDTGGTGLGLSIVRHIITNHGGHVAVASREGRGSTFTVILPRSEEDPS